MANLPSIPSVTDAIQHGEEPGRCPIGVQIVDADVERIAARGAGMTLQAEPAGTPVSSTAIYAAGISVVPVRVYGTQAPAVSWKTFQDGFPAPDATRAWFTDENTPGAGAVTMAVSGGEKG